jgi:hypothetical protein
MPLKGNVRYRVKQTSKGPVRLAFRNNKVIETKNLRTKAIHSESEFKQDRLRRKANKQGSLGREHGCT